MYDVCMDHVCLISGTLYRYMYMYLVHGTCRVQVMHGRPVRLLFEQSWLFVQPLLRQARACVLRALNAPLGSPVDKDW